MRRNVGVHLIGWALIALTALTGGCAAGQHAGRSEPPSEIKVRFPPTESPKVSVRAEEPKNSQEELPSMTDDTRRPWLKLIEVDVIPGESESPKGPEEAVE